MDGLGSGFTDVELSFRFGYEVSDNLFPYVGVLHGRLLGQTADFAKDAGEDANDVSLLVGLGVAF